MPRATDPSAVPRPSRWSRWIRNFFLPEEAAGDAGERAEREDAEFMPGVLSAFFQRPPAAPYLIVRATLLLIVAAVVWASFAEIDEITVGEGKVIPSSQVQVIQNLEGGIISRIPVKIGDIVKKGDVLAVLDDTRFSSSVEEAKTKVDALEARIARLTAEVNGTDFTPPAELVKKNPKAVESEQRLFAARKQELDSNLSVMRQQLAQRTQEANENRAKAQQLQESYGLVNKELNISRPLAKQGVMSEVEILRLERQASDISGNLQATRLAIPRIEASAAEIHDRIGSMVAKFRSDAASDLTDARTEYLGTSATSVAAEDRLKRTSLRSPVNGIVKQIKVPTIGGVLQPGMDIMEIVPIEDNLLIEAKVKPSDVGFLHPGQEAMVKITAYDFSIYGGLDGVVENISADSITDDKQGGERQNTYYLVQVRTKSNQLGTPEKPLPIIPGMMATVHIKTGKKTILEYLLKPVIKAKYNALRER